MALSSGEATNSAVAFKGTLSIDSASETIQLDGGLDVAGMTVGHATGLWSIRNGFIKIDTGLDGPAAKLPFPHLHVVVDGNGCLVGGSADAGFLGIKLVSVDSGLLLGPKVCKPGTPSDPSMTKEFQDCGSPSGIGLVCLKGSASLGNVVGVDAKLTTPIGPISPQLIANASIADIASVAFDANLVGVRLSARVAVIKVVIMLPTMEGIGPEQILAMLKNLFRFSINFKALLHGDIVIAPTSHGSGSGDNSGGGGGDNSAAGSGRSGTNDTNASGTQGTQLNQTSGALPYSGHNTPAGTVQSSKAGDTPWDLQELHEFPGVYRVVERGNEAFPLYSRALFNKSEAELLTHGQYRLIPYLIPAVLTDSRKFILACSSASCDINNLSAFFVWFSPGEVQNIDPVPLQQISPQLPPLNDGALVAPALTMYLASRKLDGRSQPNVLCLPNFQPNCAASLAYDDDHKWSLFFWGAGFKVESDSLDGRFLARCTPPTCTSNVLDAVSKAGEGFRTHVLALNDDASGFSAIVSDWSNLSAPTPGHPAAPKSFFERFDNALNVSGVMQVTGFPPWDRRFVPPWTKADQPLFAKLTSLTEETPRDGDEWIIQDLLGAGIERLGMIDTLPTKERRTIFAGYRRLGQNPCLAQKSYGTLLTALDTWKDGSIGSFGGGVSDSTGGAIAADPDNILPYLISPAVSNAGFRLNPLLLFFDSNVGGCI